VPVANKLDLKAAAAAIGAKRIELADPVKVERATGYVVGGISPIGGKKQMAALLDESARNFETIFVSAGRRGLQIELAPADLAALTRATFASIARND
jgi:Cys-tRNA(Pro)/Cys-tRNA(Cys) deacylase